MSARKFGFKFVTTAAAAGLLWTQAASAAGPQLSAPVDPLVALSALGTAGSSSAVCASTQASAAASAAATGLAGGCVLPVNEAVPPPIEQPAGVVQPTAPGLNLLPLLGALGAVVIVGALLLSGGGHGNGNLTPVSPA